MTNTSGGFAMATLFDRETLDVIVSRGPRSPTDAEVG
jgi:hypothetical protein